MPSTGITESLRNYREITENPVARLLARQHAHSATARRGWLASPVFLAGASAALAVLLLILWDQYAALLALGPGNANPIFVQCARFSAVGACALYFAVLYLLLSISRVLEGFQHGATLLSSDPVKGSLQLDELLRCAPLDGSAVINGLLAFHLRRVMLCAVFPMAMISLLLTLTRMDIHIDNDELWQGDLFLLPIYWVLLMSACLLVASTVIMSGIALGMRIRSVLGTHVIFWLLLAAITGVLDLFSNLLNWAERYGIRNPLFSEPSQLMLTLYILVSLLVFTVMRSLAFESIRRRLQATRHGEAQPAKQTGSSSWLPQLSPRFSRSLHIGMHVLPALTLAVFLLATAFLRYVPVSTGDPLYDWFDGYLQTLALRSGNASPLIGSPLGDYRYTQSSLVAHRMLNYSDEKLLAEGAARFGDDPRWLELRYLLSLQSPGLHEHEFLDSAEVRSAAESEADNAWVWQCRRLMLQWTDLESEIDRLMQVSERSIMNTNLSDANTRLMELSRLDLEREALGNQILEIGRTRQQAWPLYWMAINTNDQHFDRTALLREAIAQPSDQIDNSFLRGYLDRLATQPDAGRDRVHNVLLSELLTYEAGGIGRSFIGSNRLSYLSNQLSYSSLQDQAILLEALGQLNLAPQSPASLNDFISEQRASCAEEIRINTQAAAANGGSAAGEQGIGEYLSAAEALRDSLRCASYMDKSTLRWRYIWQATVVPGRHSWPRALSGLSWQLDELVSLGRNAIVNYRYDSGMGENLLKELDYINWRDQHRAEIQHLLDFDFASMSWTTRQG